MSYEKAVTKWSSIDGLISKVAVVELLHIADKKIAELEKQLAESVPKETIKSRMADFMQYIEDNNSDSEGFDILPKLHKICHIESSKLIINELEGLINHE